MTSEELEPLEKDLAAAERLLELMQEIAAVAAAGWGGGEFRGQSPISVEDSPRARGFGGGNR
ncbi:hypothetical protein HS125_01675 [bacterium]|nr:hypothetical protein [bacterium]